MIKNPVVDKNEKMAGAFAVNLRPDLGDGVSVEYDSNRASVIIEQKRKPSDSTFPVVRYFAIDFQDSRVGYIEAMEVEKSDGSNRRYMMRPGSGESRCWIDLGDPKLINEIHAHLRKLGVRFKPQSQSGELAGAATSPKDIFTTETQRSQRRA